MSACRSSDTPISFALDCSIAYVESGILFAPCKEWSAPNQTLSFNRNKYANTSLSLTSPRLVV